ncbi:MAG TPA: phage major capsid protein [Dissulfurispiraceae bacterium]|nr:phage major capsid protein [Dissulfurispiraceae bacterium]
MPDEIQNLADKLNELGSHIDEWRKRADKFADAADVDTAFKRIAADVGEANNKLVAEQARRDNEARELKETIEALNERLDSEHTEREKLAAELVNRAKVADGVDHEHMEAFHEYLSLPQPAGGFSPKARAFMEQAKVAHLEKRTLSEGVLPEGGFLVPSNTETDIIKNTIAMSPVFEIVRTTTITEGTELRIPKRTGTPTGYWVGESAEPTKSNATYGQITIVAHILGVETQATLSLLQDVANMENEIAIDAAEASAYQLGLAMLNGNGVGRPEGILQNADVVAATAYVNGTNTATTHLVHFDDFSRLFAGNGGNNTGLKSAYRGNATYAMNSNTLAKVFNLKDTAGNYVVQKSPTTGLPMGLLGRPFVTWEDMADDGTGGNYPVICGDFFAGYRALRRMGMWVIRDPLTAKPDVEFTFYQRIGGKVVKPEAIKVLRV